MCNQAEASPAKGDLPTVENLSHEKHSQATNQVISLTYRLRSQEIPDPINVGFVPPASPSHGHSAGVSVVQVVVLLRILRSVCTKVKKWYGRTVCVSSHMMAQYWDIRREVL